MTATEERRWIREYLALQNANAKMDSQLDDGEWKRRIVPGRREEFSLICMNPEHDKPLFSIAIQRESTLKDAHIEIWAQKMVGQAIKYAEAYIRGGVWRGARS